MKEFRTKKELLIYLGKNEKDNKLVDRLIAKGEVKKIQGVYYIEDNRSCDSGVIDELKEEINKLMEENEKLKQENKELFLESLGSSESKDNELEANYEYLQKKFRRLKRGYELVIQLTYKYAAKNMKITKEEYEEQLSDEINEVLNEEMGRLD